MKNPLVQLLKICGDDIKNDLEVSELSEISGVLNISFHHGCLKKSRKFRLWKISEIQFLKFLQIKQKNKLNISDLNGIYLLIISVRDAIN